ncbi:hypothetical protein Mtc_1260 [Methanocella conradii HZ254]|uniref:DUF5050 domain-containing protein n=2 Tax=Methanocella TaxID=570266 RepID=H8I9G9_METCZ|nr:hypothetical protein Mtc_1260 [Methanocella conradii HZ254]
MVPHPGEESIISKAIFICILVLILLIMGVCVFIIYDYLTPDASLTPVTQTPAIAVTPPPLPTMTPTPRPTATPTPTLDAGHYQQDTKVTGGDFEYYYPGIWSHYIVYDMYDGTKNYSMLYDVNTQRTTRIAEGCVFSNGAISNGKVLLFYPEGNKIYLYDINSRKSGLTSSDDDCDRSGFTMFDTKLAYYQDDGHYNTDGTWVPLHTIRVFNMVDGQTSIVIYDIPKPLDMRIYKDMLVYTVVDGEGSDVYLLDLAKLNSKPQRVSTGSGNNNHARIYDHTIVYYSDRDGKSHIYMYDINTAKTSVVATEGEQWNADIYGNTIVYDDNRNGNWDIYAYDLSTGVERRITNEPHDQRAPVIYGNRIAYMDNRNGYDAIYTMTI